MFTVPNLCAPWTVDVRVSNEEDGTRRLIEPRADLKKKKKYGVKTAHGRPNILFAACCGYRARLQTRIIVAINRVFVGAPESNGLFRVAG